jgi:hypothetical protein
MLLQDRHPVIITQQQPLKPLLNLVVTLLLLHVHTPVFVSLQARQRIDQAPRVKGLAILDRDDRAGSHAWHRCNQTLHKGVVRKEEVNARGVVQKPRLRAVVRRVDAAIDYVGGGLSFILIG